MVQSKKLKKDDNNQTKGDLFRKKIKMALSIGVASGIIWGFLSLFFYYLQFTSVGPSIYAKPLLNPNYVMKWQGHFIGLAFFIFYSIIYSLIYTIFFVRFKTPWVGIIYGVALWALLFLVLSPIFDLAKPVKNLGFNTNSVMITIYIFIGLFTGYSLSIEFTNIDNS